MQDKRYAIGDYVFLGGKVDKMNFADHSMMELRCMHLFRPRCEVEA